MQSRPQPGEVRQYAVAGASVGGLNGEFFEQSYRPLHLAIPNAERRKFASGFSLVGRYQGQA